MMKRLTKFLSHNLYINEHQYSYICGGDDESRPHPSCSGWYQGDGNFSSSSSFHAVAAAAAALSHATDERVSREPERWLCLGGSFRFGRTGIGALDT